MKRALRPAYQACSSALRRAANRIDTPVVVLMYHCVTSRDSDPHQLTVSPENFRAQMKYLRGHFPVLRFSDDWSDAREPSVVVTFDDGYANNLREALPILQEVGVPATFFLATGPIETGESYWWDELDALVLGGSAYPPAFELIDESARGDARPTGWQTATPEQRWVLREALLSQMKGLDREPRSDWLRQLRDWAGGGARSDPALEPLSVEEVVLLGSSPLAEIGAHGVSHCALSALPAARQREELTESKEKLEKWLGRQIHSFAYPYGGRAHYNRESMRLCREAGFRKAGAANFPGQAHRWTNPYEIPRQMVFDGPEREFAEKLSGFWK